MDLFGAEDLPSVEAEQTAQPPVAYEYPILYGHQAALQTLLGRVASNTPPASLIVQGAEGIGKATFVAHFICQLLNLPYPKTAEGEESHWPNMVHPDLLVVERGFDDKKGERSPNILRDDVAGVVPFLRRTASTDGGWRLVVVDDANTMNLATQNTLLKILEEPPAKTMIILVTHALGQLIQTIRSRCQVLVLHPLQKADVKACLAAKAVTLNAEDEAFWLAYAEGAPGKILQTLEKTKGEAAAKLFDLINGSLSPNPLARFELAGSLAATPYADTIYSLLLFVLNKAALAMAGTETALEGILPYFSLQTKTALEAAGGHKTLTLANTLDAFISACQSAKLDKKHIAQGVVDRLYEGLTVK